MAGMDYMKCYECGERMAYDPDHVIREQLVDRETNIYCRKCYHKLEKKIIKLEKRVRK